MHKEISLVYWINVFLNDLKLTRLEDIRMSLHLVKVNRIWGNLYFFGIYIYALYMHCT